MAISKVGTYQYGWQGSTASTTWGVTYTTVNLGDLVLATSATTAAAISVTGMSGGGVTNWVKLWSLINQSQASGIALWMGKVTSVGSVTATATLSASSSNSIQSVFQFTAGLGANTVWAAESSATPSQSSGTTITYPSMSATGAADLWYGYAVTAQTGSVGSTTNFTYQREGTAASPDFWSNIICYRVLTASGAVTAPTASQSPTGTYMRGGSLITATAGAAAAPTGNFFPFMHHEPERPGELWTPEKPRLIAPRRTVIDLAPRVLIAA